MRYLILLFAAVTLAACNRHIENFRDYLTNHGVFTTIRASRGQDIFAACGLLSTAKKIEEERKRREQQQ